MLIALLPLLLAAAAPNPPACDLLLTGGRVVDGTGAPWFRADVCVVGDRIDAMGPLAGRQARRRIDVSKLVVAPGFIDMLGQSEYTVLVDGRAASKITQGITTEITGEGGSIAPVNARMIADGKEAYEHYGVTPNWTTLAGYFKEFERRGVTINLGTFVGAGGVRNLVIGKVNRAATPEELKAMEAAVAQAMEDGAFGLSTSLIYVPDTYASTEEIVALAKVAARYGGSYITHQRNEDDTIDQSLDEVFRISGAMAEDGILSREKSHPRAWASAPRILGKYVREEKLLTLEEAIRRMTSFPASRMRLHDRGMIRPGLRADLVAFDPEQVRERSTYADPTHYSEGIPYVAVNGVLVVDEGRITSARPGRILRGPGYRKPARR